MQHGWAFNQRIREILRGRTFETKHIHFFEGYPKGDRIYIDGSTNEEIEKYFKTQEKCKVTRTETYKKNKAYWELYKEFKTKAETTLDQLTRLDLEEFLKKNHNGRIPVDVRLKRLQRKLNEFAEREGIN
jgi:phosphoribosylaminoimidazole-succinocarboxamide synthase